MNTRNLNLKYVLATLSFVLLGACGGGGGGGSPSSMPDGSSTASKVFVSYSVSSPPSSGIATVFNPNPGPGSLALDRQITGSSVSIDASPGGLFLDTANNRLYVTDLYRIRVFSNASTANGNVAPSRSITIASTVQPIRSLFVDTLNDILYAAQDTRILVFNNASTLSGISTPNRTIIGNIPGGFNNSAIFVDVPRNMLYVAGQSATPQVVVFNNASTADGASIAPSRTIDLPNTTSGISAAFGLFVDSTRDRLYVTYFSNSNIWEFDAASGVMGSATPTRTIVLPKSVKNIAINTQADRLYGVTNSSVIIANNISTANGPTLGVEVLAPLGSSIGSVAIAP